MPVDVIIDPSSGQIYWNDNAGSGSTQSIAISGNAATATTATNVTIANGSVTLAKIENITAYTILGNSNASSAATPAAALVAAGVSVSATQINP